MGIWNRIIIWKENLQTVYMTGHISPRYAISVMHATDIPQMHGIHVTYPISTAALCSGRTCLLSYPILVWKNWSLRAKRPAIQVVINACLTGQSNPVLRYHLMKMHTGGQHPTVISMLYTIHLSWSFRWKRFIQLKRSLKQGSKLHKGLSA